MSRRQLIEGEPGYGKSTLALQLLYDWCNNISDSPLRKVEILIFLRLRQLGGVTSIFAAIRRFILPRDSTLSEDDVKKIMEKSSPIMVVLDGFDEYPDQADSETDISLIIKKQMFQDVDVILTTR
ncbi:NACHT domain-containing protein, partial [Salmonella sp. s54395]|uniref:NACHT domain-containing protein n=1 Tax=Salmonella sp. s54395 TaxID=3159664 RepID=UPI00397F832B